MGVLQPIQPCPDKVSRTYQDFRERKDVLQEHKDRDLFRYL